MNPRIVEVRQNILRKNDELARALRMRFDAAGVFVVSLVSSPGAGKTALLERTLTALHPARRVAALVGDLATERDAERLRRSGAPVRQITTGTVCHLDAEMVGTALSDWSLSDLDVLFIENVGNLVCPSSYDLGEHARAVLLSTTEGEDKPLKYPTIFNTADVAILTKIDLAEVVSFDYAESAPQHSPRAARPSHSGRVRKNGIGSVALARVARNRDRAARECQRMTLDTVWYPAPQFGPRQDTSRGYPALAGP